MLAEFILIMLPLLSIRLVIADAWRSKCDDIIAKTAAELAVALSIAGGLNKFNGQQIIKEYEEVMIKELSKIPSFGMMMFKIERWSFRKEINAFYTASETHVQKVLENIKQLQTKTTNEQKA